MTVKLTLETWSLSDLREAPTNAKKHTSKQISHIKASIEEFGFRNPIGVKPDGEIVEGHGRFLAAQEAGLEEVPVLVITGLTEEQYREYRIASNKLTLRTGFDKEKLKSMVERIVGGGDNVRIAEAMGFSETALRYVLDRESSRATAIAATISGEAAASYDIVWVSPEQRTQWTRFMRRVRSGENHQMSAAQALINHITASGVLG